MTSNLVSDDVGHWVWDTNMGATLPDGIDATYDAELSPIFFARQGFVEIFNSQTKLNPYVANYRTHQGYGQSSTSVNSTYSYYSGLNLELFMPSSYAGNSTHGFSLRCLVSTKRQASE